MREEEDGPDVWGRPVSGATRASGGARHAEERSGPRAWAVLARGRGGEMGAGRAWLQTECGAGRARRGTGPWDAGALADRAAGVWLGWDGLGC